MEAGERYSIVFGETSNMMFQHAQPINAYYWKNEIGDWLHDPNHTAVSETELCEALKKVGELQGECLDLIERTGNEVKRNRDLSEAAETRRKKIEGLEKELAAANEVIEHIRPYVEGEAKLMAENRELKVSFEVLEKQNRRWAETINILEEKIHGLEESLERSRTFTKTYKEIAAELDAADRLPGAVQSAINGAEFGADVDIDKQIRDGDSAKEPVKPFGTYTLDCGRGVYVTCVERRKNRVHDCYAPNRRKGDPERIPERRKETRRDSGQVGRRTIGSSRRTGEDRRKT